MVMDSPITPYTRYAWLDAGQTVRVKLRWYPARPGAKRFPGYHLFSSGDFSDQASNREWPGAGEDKAARRNFVAGIGPMFHYPGDGHFAGERWWYTFGVPLEAIQAALLDPPGPPPGCVSADNGPPVVRLDCPRPLCYVNPLCPFHVLRVRGGVLVGGDVHACRKLRKLRLTGGVVVGGDVRECRPMTHHRATGGVLVGGDVRTFPARALQKLRGGVLVGGKAIAATTGRRWFLGGGVLVGGDTLACRQLRNLRVTGGVLVGGKATEVFITSCCVSTACCPNSISPTLIVQFTSDNPMTCPLTPPPFEAHYQAYAPSPTGFAWVGTSTLGTDCTFTFGIWCAEGGAFGWRYDCPGCTPTSGTGIFTDTTCGPPIHLVSEDFAFQCPPLDCTGSFTVDAPDPDPCA